MNVRNKRAVVGHYLKRHLDLLNLVDRHFFSKCTSLILHISVGLQVFGVLLCEEELCEVR